MKKLAYQEDARLMFGFWHYGRFGVWRRSLFWTRVQVNRTRSRYYRRFPDWVYKLRWLWN